MFSGIQLLCNTDLFDTGGDSSSNEEEEPASHTGLTARETGCEMPPPSEKPRRRSSSYRKVHKEKVVHHRCEGVHCMCMHCMCMYTSQFGVS